LKLLPLIIACNLARGVRPTGTGAARLALQQPR